jgi:hypothetical protein
MQGAGMAGPRRMTAEEDSKPTRPLSEVADVLLRGVAVALHRSPAGRGGRTHQMDRSQGQGTATASPNIVPAWRSQWCARSGKTIKNSGLTQRKGS